MSSTYRIVCMNHDPAIETEVHETNTLTAALSYIDQPNAMDIGDQHRWLDSLEPHKRCDLLIARLSGSWVEFTCPPLRPTWGCQSHHSVPNTERVDWLRLLYYARQSHTPASSPLELGVSRFDTGCWGPRRVERLMRLIGDEYATSLEPLTLAATDPRVSDVNGMEYAAYFHGGIRDGKTERVAAKPSGSEPVDVIRVGPDKYLRDDQPNSEDMWHYRIVVAK